MRNQIENYLHFAKVLVDLRSERIGEFGIIVVMEIERERFHFQYLQFKTANLKISTIMSLLFNVIVVLMGERWPGIGRGEERRGEEREGEEREGEGEERESEGKGNLGRKCLKL